jgi:hypothetical protein
LDGEHEVTLTSAKLALSKVSANKDVPNVNRGLLSLLLLLRTSPAPVAVGRERHPSSLPDAAAVWGSWSNDSSSWSMPVGKNLE